MIYTRQPLKRRKAITRKAPLRPRRNRPTAAGRAHLARVAALPCMVCGAWPVEVHHVLEGRGSQRKASDFDTIPLCSTHHRTGGFAVAIHAGASTWRERFGSEIEMLARVRAKLGDE